MIITENIFFLTLYVILDTVVYPTMMEIILYYKMYP